MEKNNCVDLENAISKKNKEETIKLLDNATNSESTAILYSA